MLQPYTPGPAWRNNFPFTPSFKTVEQPFKLCSMLNKYPPQKVTPLER